MIKNSMQLLQSMKYWRYYLIHNEFISTTNIEAPSYLSVRKKLNLDMQNGLNFSNNAHL